MLRSHYRESDATELYYQLSRARQEVKETPQEFLIRVMDLQEKEMSAGPRYGSEQVRAMFLHSLQTGFRSEGLRMDMRPYLRDPAVTDEELLEKLNVAASHEVEQQQKTNPSLSVAVHTISQNTMEPKTPNTPVSKTQ